jgi:hypothetical protein
MAVLIDQAVSVNSHTPTDFGKYDEEPFPVEGNAYYWYLRATYWKRQANRNEGVQATMDFQEKSVAVYEGGFAKITLSQKDLSVVKEFIKAGQISDAIKKVRDVTTAGLKESKDYVDSLKIEVLGPHKSYNAYGQPNW